MKQFDVVEAVFNPKRKDDLVEGAKCFIGRKMKWQAAWKLDAGPYAGQWAMMPMVDSSYALHMPFAWVPESDLEIQEAPAQD